MTLPRGFKADAERHAERVRHELGLADNAPVEPADLARLAGAVVVSAATLIDQTRLDELERIQAYAFSAATFDVAGRTFIVTNPLRSEGRLASDVAHEVAHLVLGHQLSEVREVAGMAFRTCKPDEEEQATTLGGTLLLPRPLLMAAARRGDSPTEIADRFGVTVDLARWRYNTTGVLRQVRSARPIRSA